MRLYVAADVIIHIKGIKAVAPLSRGVFLFLQLTGVLKYPTSQLSHCELSPGLYRTPL